MTEQHRRNRNPGVVDVKGTSSPLGGMDNLQLWLRADSLNLSDGNTIAIWEDESGNDRDATQAVVASRPTFQTNIVNGYPAARFAGADSLAHDQLQYNLSTHFVVWSRVNAGNNDAILMDAATTYSYLQYASAWYVFTSITVTRAMAADTFFLKSCIYDNVNYHRYTNGASEGVQAGSGDAMYRYIGAGAGGADLNGDIAEVVVFDINLSSANRQFVESYLNTKYNLW